MIYEVLTYIIIKVARLRKWFTKRDRYGACVRYDRAERNAIEPHNLHKSGFQLECCDCGLTHDLHITPDNKNKLQCIPIRPKKYKYWLRGGW
jgi:hypothetical protein